MKSVSRSVTIHEVARLAGVSAATVSRVLNGNNGVRGPARHAVEKAVAQLGFEPNVNARRLSLGKTFTIAAIVPFFYRPSYVERLRGIEYVLSPSPYELVVYNVETIELRDKCFLELPRRDRADGVIIISLAPEDKHVRAFLRRNMPVVMVDGMHPKLPSVHEDSVRGAHMAVRHLIELGHRRIAYICDALEHPLSIIGSRANHYRLEGYRKALQEAGLEYEPALFRQGPHEKMAAHALTLELLDLPNPPSAIFASSDTHALGALEAARSRGLSVPRDLSVVGYDDVEIAEYLNLTTVRQSLFESGVRGAQLLLDALGGHATVREIGVQVELVVRGSTASPRSTSRAKRNGR